MEPAQQEHYAAVGYPSRLLGREQIAEGTMAFQFERPRNFLFKAGQFVDLTLLPSRSNGSEELTHAFSIASAPSAGEIVVATRMRDTGFKRALSALPIGAQVRIKGPMGSFTLHNNVSRPAVLLAGGIGITPFLSMLTHSARNERHPRISLFYANRRLEDAAFMDRLRELESSVGDFRFVPTLTRRSNASPSWKGETGYINSVMLARHAVGLQDAICYAAGPPTMVAAALQALKEAGVDEDDIRTEEFPGY